MGGWVGVVIDKNRETYNLYMTHMPVCVCVGMVW